MDKIVKTKRTRRMGRTRAKIYGTADRPRLAVFRSNKYISLQLIDDAAGHTLVSVSAKELDGEKKISKTEQAALLGKLLAKKAIDTGVKNAVFDRRFYKYHGRIKAAAEGARSAGLNM